MLRTTIATTDPQTGGELPIPADLREKVRRAAAFVEQRLEKLGKKFDINARWEFERNQGNDFDIILSIRTPQTEILPQRLPRHALDNPKSSRELSTALWLFGDILSAELDHEFERIRRDLQELTSGAEG